MSKHWWLGCLVLSACVCPPTVHDETVYAPPAMERAITQCANEGTCTSLCAQAFFLDYGSIDNCRIVKLDGEGGALVAVTYHENVCESEGWDDGSGWGDGSSDDDPCSDGSCDPLPPDDDPCGDGSCDPPPDDPPPDDPPDDPPPDDPPPDDEM